MPIHVYIKLTFPAPSDCTMQEVEDSSVNNRTIGEANEEPYWICWASMEADHWVEPTIW